MCWQISYTASRSQGLKKRGYISGKARILAQYLLLGLYQITFGLYVRLRYGLKRSELTPIPKKGPFFLLGNHTNNFDGLFIQCLFHRPIRFVVTDGVFRHRMLGRLLNLVDYIPKRKSVSDVAAIRKILQVVKDGGIVGIFPEGGRNWDGVTGTITPATFRLAKSLRIPVVTARIRGAYLSDPRWADTKRHGRVEVQLRTVIEAGNHLSQKEITNKIAEALAHNEYQWQSGNRIAFKGHALAKGLERLVFVCPSCGSLGTVTSSDAGAWCKICNTRFDIDTYGFLHADSGGLPADRLDKINVWQQKKLAALFTEHPKDARLMTDEGGILLCAQTRDDLYKAVDSGNVVLTRNQIIVGRYGFDLSGITGINVYFKSHLEFRYKLNGYRIGFESPHVSAYKWQCATELAKQMMTETD